MSSRGAALLVVFALAVPVAPAPAPEVMLRTTVDWLDAPGGAAAAAAHAGEALQPGMRVRVHTHWRYLGSEALPRRSLVIDAAVPPWLRHVGSASAARGADVLVAADGFDFVTPDEVPAGSEPPPAASTRAVRWVLEGQLEPGAEGTLWFDAVTR